DHRPTPASRRNHPAARRHLRALPPIHRPGHPLRHSHRLPRRVGEHPHGPADPRRRLGDQAAAPTPYRLPRRLPHRRFRGVAPAPVHRRARVGSARGGPPAPHRPRRALPPPEPRPPAHILGLAPLQRRRPAADHRASPQPSP
ncbi:hypothetical protein GBAR_LOCUS11552, partial [Geodia barretti]